MASAKQITYITDLAVTAGYGKHLSSRLAADLPRDISFSSRDASRLQTVQAWAATLSTAQASAVIDWLLAKTKTAKAS
ncbi:MAG: hypothetical protein KatS3mg063_1552 [Tepidiforma sp.]|uniref:hypothetical protein n=1 Tax=Tepidiforma sp. TaxID=2682230 RepID=UPI0021DD0089|nr:hypothetical protein [Tepidiforma sp.]GIW15699.1 MAG: hypothetical protein KatS3mg063_1552 [Tepidiforma sp.]